MVASNRRAMEAMSRRKPEDSWSRAARRILRRLDRWGIRVADAARVLNAKL
jgi:hypothetical protein